ncbi:MAG: octaprenyl diphosphate synthase [Gammaproteobacteria bacterium]|nr:octaprenyl diphosphate synthase [Gammaproteobacteria bacterium]MCC6302986.1 octaprenyl diphosphate synthase [Gammaproteobacteria bacterium]
MDLDEIQSCVASDLQAVNALIHARLQTEVALINQLSFYIVNSGGKRLRPILVLLSARALGYPGASHIDLAAIIEFIHTATLLHDDVVDASELRRGKETANAVWGNEASVLVGDFLYSRAFEMMVTVKSMRVMEIMARATNVIAEGEVMQLLSSNDADTTEERYLEVIRCKTAKLFEAAAQVGAIVSGASAAEEEAMAAYGRHLGTAFQLIDDVLDYSGSSQHIGKNVGDDLAAGKPTLPLIHALRRGNPQEAAIIRNAIVHGGREKIAEVLKAIESTEALAYTARSARDEAAKAAAALAVLPASPYREAMYALAEFSVNRSY